MKTILFQGDSITDAYRVREDERSLGSGYPNLTAAMIDHRYPGEFRFINKGVGGERSTHLYTRCMQEMLACRPDYMTVLIGVNDVWHGLTDGNGVHPTRYEQILSMLVEDARDEFPDLKIVILEPFVLCGDATVNNWEAFDSGVRAVAAAAKRIAKQFHLSFVPLQDKFDAAARKTSAECWLWDGVHPTPAGHQLIAQELVKALGL